MTVFRAVYSATFSVVFSTMAVTAREMTHCVSGNQPDHSVFSILVMMACIIITAIWSGICLIFRIQWLLSHQRRARAETTVLSWWRLREGYDDYSLPDLLQYSLTDLLYTEMKLSHSQWHCLVLFSSALSQLLCLSTLCALCDKCSTVSEAVYSDSSTLLCSSDY